MISNSPLFQTIDFIKKRNKVIKKKEVLSLILDSAMKLNHEVIKLSFDCKDENLLLKKIDTADKVFLKLDIEMNVYRKYKQEMNDVIYINN